MFLTFHRTTRIDTIRLPLHVTWSMVWSMPVVALFLWYILYTGLAPVAPYYDAFDEGILLIMLGSVGLRVLHTGRIRLPSSILLGLVLLNTVILFSSLVSSARIVDAAEYFFRANRAFIVLVYIFVYDLDAERLFDWFVKVCRFLLYINLPILLYYIITFNLSLLEPINHDTVRGFFPFGNNDSISAILIVVLLYDVHALFFRGEIRSVLFIGLTYFILVTTMNWKATLLVTGGIAVLAILRSRHKARNMTILALLVVLPSIVLFPVIFSRLERVKISPVYIAAETILRGEVQEYNWLLGTGPGTFTSPMAFANQQPLTAKYGLLARQHYWTEVYTGPTGTLTTSTSSALLLLGEAGVLATLGVLAMLGWMTWCCFRYSKDSPACMAGFVLGIYIITIGFFLDSWTWGYEVLLLMLGMKAATDLRASRRSPATREKMTHG